MEDPDRETRKLDFEHGRTYLVDPFNDKKRWTVIMGLEGNKTVKKLIKTT